MRKLAFVAVMLAGFCPLAGHAQENPLLDREFWETATARDVIQAVRSGADIQVRAREGGTPLHLAVIFGRSPGMISPLLERGADINARDERGNTPLHMAARTGQTLEVVTLLLDGGARMEARNEDGHTPLHYAAIWTEEQMLYRLFREGKDIKEMKDHMEKHELEALMVSGTPELIGWLLDRGANIEVRDKEGKTPLHYAAAISKSPKSTALLLDRG
ncbi:MAG: ankyrin repeat domain-containing protein, partial [Hyphomicrobiales bacterium]|nr:ankyrin repeat domain-containing protein [Hyphomicrobiales bacterium]